MQYNDSWRHKKKNDEIQSATRSKRRVEESLIKKIKLIVPDKIWFESLTDTTQMRVVNSYYNYIRFNKNVGSFWKSIKQSYPGDLSKQRDLKLDILFKSDKEHSK
jgi:hypothetical protein